MKEEIPKSVKHLKIVKQELFHIVCYIQSIQIQMDNGEVITVLDHPSLEFIESN